MVLSLCRLDDGAVGRCRKYDVALTAFCANVPLMAVFDKRHIIHHARHFYCHQLIKHTTPWHPFSSPTPRDALQFMLCDHLDLPHCFILLGV